MQVSTSILSREGQVPEQGCIVILLTEYYEKRRAGKLSFERGACPDKVQKLSCQAETF